MIRFAALMVAAVLAVPFGASADIDTTILKELAAKRGKAPAKPTAVSRKPSNSDAEVQFRTAQRFDQRRDFANAARWYRKAAEQGHVQAQTNLALMYSEGQGVKQDIREAAKWFDAAARGGDATAQYSLGLLYYQGAGVKQSYDSAMQLWILAARSGNASAMNNLAIMHGMGEGVAQSNVEAYAWFDLAARLGDDNAAKNRDLTAEEMSRAEVGEGQRRAQEIAGQIGMR